ncbi:MAG: NADPH-dependent FMN reductase, partial [Sutterellaceae bacterium]|nr:NAD(P)H-dependent oxidoreductase [Burkholderiaceae bacterium]MDW8430857.1 NADPH-dependent FMN reductase [Sutterellaceae bacterium]
ALLIATPEYNNGIPGVLKNAIDWLSRPPADIARVFGGKPVAVVGATIGAFGTALAQSAWLPVLRLFNVRPYFGARLMIARAADVFDAGGKVKDETVAQQIRSFADGFVRFVREVCAAPA